MLYSGIEPESHGGPDHLQKLLVFSDYFMYPYMNAPAGNDIAENRTRPKTPVIPKQLVLLALHYGYAPLPIQR